MSLTRIGSLIACRVAVVPAGATATADALETLACRIPGVPPLSGLELDIDTTGRLRKQRDQFAL